MERLTQTKLARLDDGIYADGTVVGLYYRVRGIYRSWIFRRSVNGKRYEVGVGGSDTEINSARRKAAKLRAMTADDFIEQLTAAPEVVPKNLTFADVVEKYRAWKVEVGDWEEGGGAEQRAIGRMKNHALPVIGKFGIGKIREQDIAQIADRLRGKADLFDRVLLIVKTIFDWAKAKGYCSGDNPADKRGALKFLLPKQEHQLKNMGALAVRDLPEFFKALHDLGTRSAKLFMFSVLTATRSLTVRRARWEDIDLAAAEWRIDKDDLKVKANGGLIVPLAPQAVELLRSLDPQPEGYVFSGRSATIYSNGVFQVVRKIVEARTGKRWYDEVQSLKLGRKIPITQHGVARGTFRTWAQDDELGNDKRFDPIVAELCLHHKPDTKYNGAYERNSFMKRRRELMEAWAKYCYGDVKN